MNRWIATAVLVFVNVAGAQAQEIKRKGPPNVIPFAAKGSEGGSNVGGSNDGIQVVTDWADDVSEQLNAFHEIAVMKKADGNLNLAIDIYKDGLEKILESAGQNPNQRLTWTYKTAERAFQLAQRLGADQAPLDAQYDVLSYFYSLIESHYFKLDAAYFRRCTSKPYSSRALDNHLQAYATDLLSWFERSMIVNANDGSVAPLYSDRVFFITFATLTKGLSEDFGAGNTGDPSLFPTRYAALAKMLARSAKQIEGVLAGNGAYSTEPRAVQAAYNDLKKIQSELK